MVLTLLNYTAYDLTSIKRLPKWGHRALDRRQMTDDDTSDGRLVTTVTAGEKVQLHGEIQSPTVHCRHWCDKGCLGLHCLRLYWGRQPKHIVHTRVQIRVYTRCATTQIPKNHMLTGGVSLWRGTEMGAKKS